MYKVLTQLTLHWHGIVVLPCTLFMLVRMFIILCLPTNRDTVNAEAVGWLAPGVLLYFVDGVLPLLRVSNTKS